MESDDNTTDVQGASSAMETSPTGEEAEHPTVLATSPAANEFISITIPINPKVAKKKELTERFNNGLAEAETVSRVGLSSPSPSPKTGETEKKLKSKAIRHPWDKFENLPLNFPDEKAELTDDQIRLLIMQGPCIRKRYYSYFNAGGHIRQQFYRVIFEKKPDGQMMNEDWVINSNVHPRWENVMQRWKYHNERESSGIPPRKRQSKPSKKKEAVQEGSGTKNDNDCPEQSLLKAACKKSGRLSERLCTPASEGFPESLPDALNTVADTDKTAMIAAVSAAEFPMAQSTKPSASGPSYRSRSRPSRERLSHSAARTGTCDDMFLRPERRRSRSPHDRPTVQNRSEAKLHDSVNLSHSIDRYLDNEALQSIQKYEMGDLELMSLNDLSAFVKSMDRNINKLQATLMQSSEVFGNWEVKKKVNELRTSLLALQVSCLKLQEQLEADRMGEQ